MKFYILNRWDSTAKFTAEIDCPEDTSHPVKMMLAIKRAIKVRADLSGADLIGANLRATDLRGMNLRDADLRGADLRGTNLRDANLRDADLSGANLRDAYLRGADLRGTNLSDADLSDAILRDANLRDADLSGANLRDADLSGANLSDANLDKLTIARTRILPDGDLIGWKKCLDGIIVKLRIPAEAKRSHAFGRKCRAEYADVLEVAGGDKGVAQHDGETEYVAGSRVTASSFDEDWRKECAPGIHFYITREEAEDH